MTIDREMELLRKIEALVMERERLRADIERWHRETCRLSCGLLEISQAPKTAGSSVLRSVAYDVALNCMDGDTAKFQILRRAGIVDEQNAPDKSST